MMTKKRPKILHPHRNSGGVFVPDPRPALARFASKCAFDPVTGCVMWNGTLTAGQGHHEPYGYFWYEGKMWLAHRWSAIHIHGHVIDNMQVDHYCPAGPSTLCVEHVQPETAEVNRALQHTRPGRAWQDLRTKQHWLFVSKGIREYQPRPRELDGVPFYDPPAWLQPFMPKPEIPMEAPF